MGGPATHILWLDLETTGSDDDSDIIEIGVTLTKATPDLPVVASWSSPIEPRSADSIESMDAGVTRMHRNNGLLDAIEQGNCVSTAAADHAIRRLLDEHVPPNRRVPLGGSGVGHFDRKFVNRDLPEVAKRLTYWPIDVGVVRRMLQMVGAELPPAPEKTHRALECVREALDEGRRYLGLLTPRPLMGVFACDCCPGGNHKRPHPEAR